jgi:hypothetical protein
MVKIGDEHVSKTPRKALLTQRVVKLVTATVVVVVRLQRRIMAPKYRPIGSFCISMALGYCHTRYLRRFVRDKLD